MNRTLAMSIVLITGCAPPVAAEPDGAAVFAHWCAPCHDSKPAAPGRLKLAWTRGEDNSLLVERTDLDAAYIATVVRQGQAEMPAFRATEINAAELAALSAWLSRPRNGPGGDERP